MTNNRTKALEALDDLKHALYASDSKLGIDEIKEMGNTIIEALTAPQWQTMESVGKIHDDAAQRREITPEAEQKTTQSDEEKEMTDAEKYFEALWHSIEKHIGVDPECAHWPDVIRAALKAQQTTALSTEAIETLTGMAEFCVNHGYCMGMDEGRDGNGKYHLFVQEILDFSKNSFSLKAQEKPEEMTYCQAINAISNGRIDFPNGLKIIAGGE